MRIRVRPLASILATAALLLPAASQARALNKKTGGATTEPAAPTTTAAPAANISGVPAGVWTGDAMLALDIPTFSGTSIGPRFTTGVLYSLGEVSPNLRLELGPRAAISYNGGDASLWTVDVLACARLSVIASPTVSIFGEIGLGVGYANFVTPALPGGQSVDHAGFLFDLLFAPGFIYALGSDWNLIGEIGFWMNAETGLGMHAAVPTLGIQRAL